MADSTSSFRDKVEAFLPARERVGRQAVGAAQFGHGRAGLPLLEEGEFLFGGKAAAPSAFGWWIGFICIRLNMPFRLSKSQLGQTRLIPRKRDAGLSKICKNEDVFYIK